MRSLRGYDRVVTLPRLAPLALWVALVGCVPEGPATPPEASNPDPSSPALDPAEYIVTPFSDAFDRDEVGPGWNALGDA